MFLSLEWQYRVTGCQPDLAMMKMTTDDLLLLRRTRSRVKSGAARSVRIDSGLSRLEVARAAEISERSLIRWEQGRTTPHGPAALRYGRVLDRLMGDAS